MADQLYGWSLSATRPAIPRRMLCGSRTIAITSPGAPPAVHDQLRAGHVARGVRREINHRPRHLRAAPDAPHRAFLAEPIEKFRIRPLRRRVGERPRADRVHADLVRR